MLFIYPVSSRIVEAFLWGDNKRSSCISFFFFPPLLFFILYVGLDEISRECSFLFLFLCLMFSLFNIIERCLWVRTCQQRDASTN